VGSSKAPSSANVEHHIGDCGALPEASKDYAIVISRNLDNDVWAGVPLLGSRLMTMA